jgi:DNA-binding response OmpR family regulator
MGKTVIYVEDEPDDAFFMERVFQQNVPHHQLKIFKNGTEAAAFFSASFDPDQPSVDKPALVLLDLNLPGSSGFDILQSIRAQAVLKHLPVIMYTSSNQAVDIVKAYDRGCDGYVVKPQSAEKLKDVINALTGFWLRDNQYPFAM